MWGQGQGQGFNQGLTWSQTFGGNGGGPAEFAGPNYSLIAARGKGGGSMDSVQFLFVDVTTGQCVETPRWGGLGGGDWAFQAPPGQWIDKIYVISNNLVNALTFETNMGVRSAKFGGTNGQQGQLVATGKRISGVRVRCGTLIDQISFCTAL